jgi:2-aminoadipate transaminase
MSMALLDFTSLLAPGLPPPAAKWTGFAKYNFIGGHNDSGQLPLDALIRVTDDVLTREGRTLATYGLSSGPLGYRRLREFLAQKLERTARIRCGADEILITSGSLQALDLVNGVLLRAGDLSGRADPSAAARRGSCWHSARRRWHAHGCARRRA